MNAEQAKKIPLTDILDKLGCKPARIRNHDFWYLSPLRQEKTAGFKVNTARNIWYDFGEGIGGTNIDFVRAYLKSTHENHTVSDALRWIRNMMRHKPVVAPVTTVDYSLTDRKLTLPDVKGISQAGLIHYLEARGIPIAIANNYLKEVRVHNGNT